MQKRKFSLDGMMFAIIGGLICWYWYVGQGHVSYTMDSLTYRDVALNILNGNGFVTTNTFDTTPLNLFRCFCGPQLYPSLWAALADSGIDIDIVPKVLSPVALHRNIGAGVFDWSQPGQEQTSWSNRNVFVCRVSIWVSDIQFRMERNVVYSVDPFGHFSRC